MRTCQKTVIYDLSRIYYHMPRVVLLMVLDDIGWSWMELDGNNNNNPLIGSSAFMDHSSWLEAQGP